MSTKVKGFVPSTFRDAGTEETFEGGKTHDFDPGAHANYVAAGLIGDQPAKSDAAAPAETGKGKPA